jgi:uncharacterized phage protein (TIGR02218 family)
VDGPVLGFTNHDRDLTFGGTTYEASTGFLGTEIESQLGMAVDNMDVYGAVDSVKLKEADIEAGRYDSADIEVYLVNWADVTQRVIMKKGTLGEVKRGKVMFQTEVRGISHQLQNVKGRLYQYACDALLGDTRCGKDISGATYTKTGAVVGSTNGYSTLTTTSLGSYSQGWFGKGRLTFTSGANLGISREVKSHFNTGSISSISLWEPTPFEIQPADTFTIVAGCDKTFKTCKAKFANAVNFRGFPHIPGSNTVIMYANTGDPNFDGGGNFVGKD